MDQNSTDGTGTDKRSWRERLGIGSKEMPKISDEFKAQPAAAQSVANGEDAVSAPVRAPQQAVTRPAPMAPRAGSTRPAVPVQRSAATAEAPGADSLADKLRAQRAAAEKLAEQRVNAAREKAEAKSAAQTAFPPSRPPLREAARAAAPERPKFSFAEGDGLPQRREPAAATNGALRSPPPLVPPRPALGQDRAQPGFSRPPGGSYRQDPVPPYRPIDPSTGYTQPPRQSQMPPPRTYGSDYGNRG